MGILREEKTSVGRDEYTGAKRLIIVTEERHVAVLEINYGVTELMYGGRLCCCRRVTRIPSSFLLSIRHLRPTRAEYDRSRDAREKRKE